MDHKTVAWEKLTGQVLWFLTTRVAILAVCVAVPLGIGWLVGWLSE